MNNTVYTIDEIRNRFEKVARQHQIDEAYLFGSYARGDATKKSDIDFYIRADKIRCLFDLGGLYVDIKDALKKNIDIVTTNTELDEKFEKEIKNESVKIYG